MHLKIKTVSDAREYFAGLVSDETKLLAEFDAARSIDTLANFLHWNAVTLQVAVVQAVEARRFLAFFDDETRAEGEGVMGDERKMQLLREDIERHILNMSCRIASRSTSLSSNTEDDARNAFWIEAWQRFVGGLG